MTNSPPMGPAAGLRIAAVEDETLIAMDLQDILMGAGAKEVLIAHDIKHLSDIIKLNPPDIAIVNVEPANGAAACARMLQEAAVPFFFATGVSDVAVLGAFAVPIVIKPYSADAILSALQKVLDGARRSDG